MIIYRHTYGCHLYLFPTPGLPEKTSQASAMRPEPGPTGPTGPTEPPPPAVAPRPWGCPGDAAVCCDGSVVDFEMGNHDTSMDD